MFRLSIQLWLYPNDKELIYTKLSCFFYFLICFLICCLPFSKQTTELFRNSSNKMARFDAISKTFTAFWESILKKNSYLSYFKTKLGMSFTSDTLICTEGEIHVGLWESIQLVAGNELTWYILV